MGRYVPSGSTAAPVASGVAVTPAGGVTATDVQQALQDLDTNKLDKSGGSLTGFLTLHANPTSNVHAATKGYVDATNGKIQALASAPASPSTGELYYDTTDLVFKGWNGTTWEVLDTDGNIDVLAAAPASPATGYMYFDTGLGALRVWDGATWNSAGGGGGSTVASGITVTPVGNVAATDVQAAIQELDSEKLDKSGGTMTGALTLSGAPTTGLHATTKTYVDNADTHVGAAAPTGAGLYEGRLWYDTANDVVKSYNGTTWNALGAGGGTVVAIDDLSDVDTTTNAPTSGTSFLSWDGTNWVPDAVIDASPTAGASDDF